MMMGRKRFLFVLLSCFLLTKTTVFGKELTTSITSKNRQQRLIKNGIQQSNHNINKSKLITSTVQQHPCSSSSSTPLPTKLYGGGNNNDNEIRITLPVAVSIGMLLAFNSGYLNGCTLAGVLSITKKQVTAAVTGAYTNSALGLASGNKQQFYDQLCMILSYAFGSTIASIFNPYPVAFQLSISTTGPTFLIASIILLYASFGKLNNIMHVYMLVAIANGIQNSITSVHTANLIRSAHYSGMTSDIGTFIGQYIMGNKSNLYRIQISIALAICFWTGGYVSYSIVQDTTCFVYSAVLYAFLGLCILLLKY